MATLKEKVAETELIDLPAVFYEVKTSENCVMLVGAQQIVCVGLPPHLSGSRPEFASKA
jgi:hypothetical protein